MCRWNRRRIALYYVPQRLFVTHFNHYFVLSLLKWRDAIDKKAMSGDFSVGKLRGHKGSVSCLQLNAPEQTLISGSEDKTVRLWDLRTNRTAKCVAGCFTSDIEAVRYGYDKNVVHVATSNALFSFDMRFEGLLSKEPLSQVNFSENGDEVSSIALNSKGDTLAVAMDSGVINLLAMKANGTFCENAGATRYKRLTRVHSNIVSTIQFKKNNPRELLSGGFDYIGCVWDIDKGRPKVSSAFQPIPVSEESEDAAPKMQLVNPPFVMHMSYMMDGRCVAAACGDGSIRVLSSKDLSLCTPQGVIEDHHCMVTALFTDQEHIVSGGTDSTIHAYKLSSTDATTGTGASITANKKASSGSKKTTPLPSLSLQHTKLFTIAHDHKINTIVSSFEDSVSDISAGDSGDSKVSADADADVSVDSVFRAFSSANTVKVYVGDLSNDITVYCNAR